MKKLMLALLVVVVLGGLLMVGCSKTSTTTTSTPASTAASTTSTAAAKPVALRWAHFAAVQLESSVPLTQMAENIGKRTNGRYTAQIFWSDSLVPMFEAMDAVRTGAAEMASFPFGPFGSADIRFASSEMPFYYNTIEAQLEAQGALMPSYSGVFAEKFNQRALMVTSIIPLNIGCVKHPIKTIDDWKGLMVQSISSVTSSVVTAFGATGAPASPIDVYELLEKGTVDATIQSLGKFVEAKLWEVCPYLTNAGLCPASAALTINLDVWNKMPKDVQDIIIDEANKAEATVNQITKDTYYSYLDTLSKNMTVYNLPKADRDKWKALVAPIDDDLLSKMGDFANDVRKTADEANAKYPYPY
jgi:TRAP-type C4-dicarboxylate transport system substrate-binding protein